MSWRHDYDDYFEGLSMNERNFHYLADEEHDNPLKVNFFVMDQLSDSIGSIDFFVNTENRVAYEQNATSMERLFQSASLLTTPIEVLEQMAEEKRKMLAVAEERARQEALENLNEEEKAEEEKIRLAQKRDRQLWVDKYLPKRFDELLSNDKTNREVLCWLKAWDPIVFKRKLRRKKLAAPYVSHSYGKNMFGQTAATGHQSSNYGQFSKPASNSGGAAAASSSGSHQNSANPTGQQQQQQHKPFFFDLEDEYSLTKMQNSVILLAGPPGSGKTTLARTIAAHCGYKHIEINASEDRTAATLIDRIEMMTKNEVLQFKSSNQAGSTTSAAGPGGNNPNNGQQENKETTEKPTLIIIDEVDGALESENHGAVNLLLDFIFKGEKPNPVKPSASAANAKAKAQKKKKIIDAASKKSKGEDDEDEDEDNDKLDEEEEKTGKDKLFGGAGDSVHIRRPVIFICNDMYSKGLRELRKRALVFNFAKARSEKLMARLKEICQKEKLYLDQGGLLKICEHNENDIRSTLMNLQMISNLERQSQRKSRLSIDQILLEEKNNTKSALELLETIFMVSSLRNAPQVDIMRYSIHTLIKNTESNVLLESSLINYGKLKTAERYFDRIPRFLRDLAYAETLENNLMKHNYEMGKFISLPFINFGLLLKCPERAKLDYPRDGFQLKRRFKAAVDCVESLLENLPGSDAPYMSKKIFVLEYLTNLYQIIQPQLQSNMMSDAERKGVFTSLSVMIDFSLKLLDHPIKLDRNGISFTIYFTPQIERMLIYGGTTPEQHMNEKSIHFIQKNYDMIVHQKALAKDLGDDVEQQKKIEEKIKNIQMLDVQYAKKVVKRKQRIEGEDAVFLYKFREGVSIPIKYDVKMQSLFD